MAYATLSYQPDPEQLKARFRTWHVEALLNQAADLIDKCLEDLRGYNSLDYASNQFQIDLEAQQKEFDLDKARTGYFERDEVAASKRKAFLAKSKEDFDDSLARANQLYQQGSGGPSTGHAGLVGLVRAHQSLAEKKVEVEARSLDNDLTNLHVTWAKQDASYNKDRLKIREDILQKKKNLAVPGKAFGLDSQRNYAWARLKSLYEDALNRASVAEEGLKKIYGYSPAVGAQPPADQDPNATVSHLAIWIRRSIEWLVAYGQLDQAFTRIVSLRALLDRQIWNQLSGASERFSTSLRIPGEMFASHENVRLRGIGAAILGKAGIVPWSLTVKLPKKAVYMRNGVNDNQHQSDLPNCLLGRVENRQSFRALEVCGLISLTNASPIGQTDAPGTEGLWSIEMVKPAGTSEKFLDIDDILIEINVVGIPK